MGHPGMGLKQQIQSAKSECEIEQLLDTGAVGYAFASDETRRQWTRAADKRRRGLALIRQRQQPRRRKSA